MHHQGGISNHQRLRFLQHLDVAAEDARTLFGWNFYPAPQPGTPEAQQLRLLPHADTDVITLLFQHPGMLFTLQGINIH